MIKYIDLGIVKIHMYSIMILIGVVVGVLLFYKELKRHKITDTKFIDNLLFYSLIFGILGARIYYVIFNINQYPTILDMLKIYEGGLAIHGGLIAGILVFIVMCKKYKYSPLKFLDIASMSVILAQGIARWGNFFNQEAFGDITTYENLKDLHIPNFIIDNMFIDGLYRQPTFLFESVACIIGFIVLYNIRKLKNLKIGTLTALYLIYYGIIRYFIEIMRSDSLMLGNMKMAMIVSIIFVFGGIIILVKSYLDKKLYNEE